MSRRVASPVLASHIRLRQWRWCKQKRKGRKKFSSALTFWLLPLRSSPPPPPPSPLLPLCSRILLTQKSATGQKKRTRFFFNSPPTWHLSLLAGLTHGWLCWSWSKISFRSVAFSSLSSLLSDKEIFSPIALSFLSCRLD